MREFHYLCIFMHGTSLEEGSVSRSTIISRGGYEIRETPKVYRGSRVPGSSETNPALQKRKCGYFYGTNFFLMRTFLWNKYLFKNIYVYTCIFTVLTLGPTLKHP